AVAQRAKCNAEELGRCSAVVARLFERFEYGFLFNTLEILGQRRGCPQPHEILLGDGLGVLVSAELQIFNAYLVSRGKSKGALEDVLEFADVSRKSVGLKGFRSRRTQPGRVVVRRGSQASQNLRCHQRDVLAHVAKRWHRELDDGEPIEQVLAEIS